MVVHLDHVQVKFEYQGHWVKVKVTVGHQILLLQPTCGITNKITITTINILMYCLSF